MKDIMVLRDLDQIKAISHPYRVEVLESFERDEPRSAKQVAEKLGEPHAKVNYHIKSLLKVEILELVDERIKAGIVEKYYLPAAKVFVIDKNFMKNIDEDVLQSINQVAISLFEKTSAEFYRASEQLVEETKFINQFSEYYLSREEMKDLTKKVEATITEYLVDKKDQKRQGTRPYSITVLGIPKVTALKKRG
ncbi:regulatory protein, ArsR [Alkaliphilus metalliredigens QYMF]|uniref:Regulatory protein, ArsR n=1 Tax=Alkaliphilus metalliredigens (strain QYMF) TaxID=293826 RepID=A6TU94_ALKMQ|nr:transcriptional regulator [Alkaliphilus metalliredigens]ABR49762.1 regulatory protein, ArsR [Alkaliphilus metalliredigens QYMF]